MVRSSGIALALVFALAACGHADVVIPSTPSTTTPTSLVYEPGGAHQTVLDATGCWFGGMWNDALEDRSVTPKSRCAMALSRAYGGGLDPVRFERLRAAEPIEVRDLADRVRTMASLDPADAARADGLATLLVAVGAAEREQMDARRASDRVKMDQAGIRQPGKTKLDERDGADELAATHALAALFDLDAGEVTPEARTIAVMIAVDRIGLAVDLPKHQKVLALQGAIAQLFDIHPPPMPADPAAPLGGGAWLAYLEDVANAAEHPVPRSVDRLALRERLAWAGMLAGVARRLRVEKGQIKESSELTRAADGICRRLEQQYRLTAAGVLLATP